MATTRTAGFTWVVLMACNSSGTPSIDAALDDGGVELADAAAIDASIDAANDAAIEPDAAREPDAGVDAGLAEPCALEGHEVDLVPSGRLAPRCSLDGLRSELDVAYVAGDPNPDGPHRFDIYWPEGTGPFPLAIFVHGGGFQTGDEDNPSLAARLVCGGYALASIDYRVASEGLFPAAVHDVKAAIRFLRANAARFDVDPDRFGLFGVSAGASLVALAGTSDGVDFLEGAELGNASVDSSVRAVVGWATVVDFSQQDPQLAAQGCPPEDIRHGLPDSGESLFVGCAVADPECAEVVQQANPVTYADASDPPFLLVHGTEDCTVARGQSTLLADALLSARACVAERSYRGAGHSGPEWAQPPTQDSLLTFFDTHVR